MIKKIKIKTIKNAKGNIVKFFNFDQKLLKKYGEIYFSEVKKNKFKGWKFHHKKNQVMTICSGIVEFSFKKKDSGKVKKIKLSYPKNLYAIYIPKNIFYSFKCLSKQKAIIINLVDESF
tara:strand:- start:13 stop:369 length:357 start_codon:yes stop_codon:yes gene_type:complete